MFSKKSRIRATRKRNPKGAVANRIRRLKRLSVLEQSDGISLEPTSMRDSYVVKKYNFKANSIGSLFKTRPSFRSEILNSKYFYYDNRVWIYHPEVFSFEASGIKISKKAREHPEKYCLCESFTVKTVAVELQRGVAFSTDGATLAAHENEKKPLFDKLVEKSPNSFFKNPTGVYYSETQYYETVKCISDFIDNGGYGNVYSFSTLFSKLLDDRKISIKKLADLTNISSKTIERMRRDDNYTPSIEYIILCCIVLRLPPWDSDMLLYFAGYRLRITDTKDRIYLAIIHILYIEGSIELCDNLLKEYKFPTLSSIVQRNQKKT